MTAYEVTAYEVIAYEVIAYRGNRNWHLKRPDYRKTVRDGDGKPPAREQAEAVRQELAERSHRNRLGWTHIDIQVMPREPEEKPWPRSSRTER